MQPLVTTPILAPRPATTRDELRALVLLAGPLVAANLLQMAVYAVDVVFVAQLGTVEFAAATLGVFLFRLFMWAMIGLTGACAPLIAAELGARAHAVRQVRRSFRMAMWLGALVSGPVMLLLAHGETILRYAGQDPAVAARTGVFLDILLWCMFPGVAAGIMRTAAAALGRQGWAIPITAGAVAVGVLTNWLFIFGHGGFPAMGLAGSALASVVTSCAMALAWVAVLILDPKLRRYRLFGRWWRSEWSRLWEIVKLGVPIALTMTFEGALFGGAAFLMGLIGVNEVAAHAVALNIAAVAFQIPFGVAQAATIRVGMGYGAADHGWIARAGAVALAVGVGSMAVTALLIWLFPRAFVGLYLDLRDPANAAVVPLAVQYLFVAAIFQLADGAQAVAAGILRGLQDTRVPMLIALGGYWVAGFGTAILLGFSLRWEGVGIWVGLAVGLLVVSALLLWRWRARGRLGLLPAEPSRA
ncbi:MAG: MATE family efflux transporter [Pseudomonadota bacterium]